MKENATQRVAFDDVHSLLAEVTDVGRCGFPQDQRLGILHAEATVTHGKGSARF